MLASKIKVFFSLLVFTFLTYLFKERDVAYAYVYASQPRIENTLEAGKSLGVKERETNSISKTGEIKHVYVSRSHKRLIEQLERELKNAVDKDVFAVMLRVDRKYYAKNAEEKTSGGTNEANAAYRVSIYENRPSDIGKQQTISAPHMHAYALQFMKEVLQPGKNVLDIGSGSGYLTVCMAIMVNVSGEENTRNFAFPQQKTMGMTEDDEVNEKYGYTGIRVHITEDNANDEGDGTRGRRVSGDDLYPVQETNTASMDKTSLSRELAKSNEQVSGEDSNHTQRQRPVNLASAIQLDNAESVPVADNNGNPMTSNNARRGSVIGAERIGELTRQSLENIRRDANNRNLLKYGSNFKIIESDGIKGYGDMRFDGIHVGAAASEGDVSRIKNLLAPGGVLVTPVQIANGPQKYFRFTKKKDGGFTSEELFYVSYVPLTH